MEEKCPHCNRYENVLAVQQGYANLVPTNKIFTFKEEPLYHIVCLRCGTIIRSYVKNPKKFLVEKKEKNKKVEKVPKEE